MADDVDDEYDDSPEPEVDPKKLLDPAARAARSLAIRRAIEAKVEKRRMDAEFNYLDDEVDD